MASLQRKGPSILAAYWDQISEEGKVSLDQGFAQVDPLIRADLLRDVLWEVQQLYEKAVLDMREEFEQRRQAARSKADQSSFAASSSTVGL